jgi:hypothetical protein
LLRLISESDTIVRSVDRIVHAEVPSEEAEDTDGDIYALAKRVSQLLQNMRDTKK